MTSKQVLQQEIHGPIVHLIIHRPESLNALNRDVLAALEQHLVALAQLAQSDPASLRVIVVRGAGERAFVAGADISMMNELSQGEISQYVGLGQRVMRLVEALPVPVIAQVQGFALGGGMELALACDLIVASERAKFGQPEVNLGIVPGFGGTQRLVHRCGLSVAKRLCLTGDHIGADEALRLGVVDYVVPGDELEARVQRLAETIVGRGPLAVRDAKMLIQRAVEVELLSGLCREADAFSSLFRSSDRKEGFAAFLEKRSPDFTGE
ncbi:MAG: enoyl-CoA hydratase/isomerase family protein [Bdellovibrionales bacterium]|nr:enoyl-CoA hydratase/isomerase family protein [Bdellovibrionales bacterium]